MTDRGLPSADGSPACPFVAFEDERDERADRPDHRHRCFAEAEPAPRALAHQEAYCLSSAFPVCPVFQEWARREAAHARSAAATPPPVVATPSPGEEEVAWRERPDDTPLEQRPRRNPPRDWAAPPPWAGGATAGGATAGGARDPGGDLASEFLARRSSEGQGLAGSAADRLAGGRDAVPPPVDERPGRDTSEGPASDADPELAGLVGWAGAGRRSVSPDPLDPDDPDGDDDLADARPMPSGRRPAVSSTRDRNRERDRERERERERVAAERGGPQDGPSWERQRRYEAYPSIRTRAGLSGVQVPRLTLLFGALIIAAIALFFLPALLGVGGPEATPPPAASPTPAEPTASPEPTPIPEPTPVVYVIKSGDTLSKIARSFDLTVEQLLEANPGITDPNRIAVGDELVIPTPPPDEVGGETSPEPSA